MGLKLFQIRDARAQDIIPMAELIGQLFEIEKDFTADIHLQKHGLAALLADHQRSVVKVAEIDNQIVGLCTAQILISTAEGGYCARIEDLIVTKEYRGQGIGSELLIHIRNWAATEGCVRLQLLADYRNKKALKFYKRIGYTQSHMISLNKTMQISQLLKVPVRKKASAIRRKYYGD